MADLEPLIAILKQDVSCCIIEDVLFITHDDNTLVYMYWRGKIYIDATGYSLAEFAKKFKEMRPEFCK